MSNQGPAEDPTSSRSGSPPPPSPTAKLVVRRRANTFTSPPQPETTPSKYTKERVQEGIDYASARLLSTSRKPSPTTQKALAEYALACEDFLKEESLEKLVDIRRMEQDLCEKKFLQALKDETQQELTTSLQELRRYQFLEQYGDYLEQACRKLKIAATKHHTSEWESLAHGQKWTTISQNLKEEETEWKKSYYTHEDRVKTTIAVKAACQHIGIDYDQAVKSLHLYAERNEKFHNSFNHDIERGKFSEVAHTLYNDLLEVERVCSLADVKEQILLETLIEELIESWFDRFLPYEPSSWVPKQALLDEAVGKNPEQRRARAAENKEQAEANAAAKVQKMAGNDQILAILMTLEPGQLTPKELTPLADGKGKKRQSKEVEEPFTPHVTFATFSLCGTAEPLPTPAALSSSLAAGGVLSAKVKLRSS
jgi:hypothetical protein